MTAETILALAMPWTICVLIVAMCLSKYIDYLDDKTRAQLDMIENLFNKQQDTVHELASVIKKYHAAPNQPENP